MQNAREWCDPPVQVDRMASLPGSPGATSLFTDPEHGICEASGRFSCCDFWVSAPAEWWAANVQFRIAATVGPIVTTLDLRSIQDLQGPPQLTPPVPPAVDPQTVNGLLFSIRGKPCDKFSVSAFSSAADLPLARFYMRAWGGDIGIYGDRNTRLPVDLFARPNQQQRYSRGIIGNDPVDGDIVIPANPNGGRVFLTHVSWTTVQANLQVELVDDIPGAPAVQPLESMRSGGAAAALGQAFQANYTYPAFSRRGAQVLLSAPGLIALGTNHFNVVGFWE